MTMPLTRKLSWAAAALCLFMELLDARASQASTDFVVPPGAEDLPLGITTGPDGNLWFTNEGGRTIARITTDGTITKFPIPNGIAPERIVAGPDGNLWFTDAGGDFIGKITTAGGFTEYTLRANSQPIGITLGADNALWFAEQGTKNIGRITTSGQI